MEVKFDPLSRVTPKADAKNEKISFFPSKNTIREKFVKQLSLYLDSVFVPSEESGNERRVVPHQERCSDHLQVVLPAQ